MKKSVLEVDLPFAIEAVWEVVINNQDYQWRSDLQKIEIIDETHFREYYNEKQYTSFEITQKIPYQQYNFQMENSNFVGEWEGIFSKIAENVTHLIFTEQIQVKNPILRIISSFAMPLKKMQLTYLKDLKKKLAENEG